MSSTNTQKQTTVIFFSFSFFLLIANNVGRLVINMAPMYLPLARPGHLLTVAAPESIETLALPRVVVAHSAVGAVYVESIFRRPDLGLPDHLVRVVTVRFVVEGVGVVAGGAALQRAVRAEVLSELLLPGAVPDRPARRVAYTA